MGALVGHSSLSPALCFTDLWGFSKILGARAMTTKFLDNKICTFKLLLSWHFPRTKKTAFWTIFLSAPKPPPPKKKKYCHLSLSEILGLLEYLVLLLGGLWVGWPRRGYRKYLTKTPLSCRGGLVLLQAGQVLQGMRSTGIFAGALAKSTRFWRGKNLGHSDLDCFTRAQSSALNFLIFLARAIRNAIRANRFAIETPIFYSAPGRSA